MIMNMRIKLKNKAILLGGIFLSLCASSMMAQDYPANPLEKEGYRLIFHDEFDGKEIDRTKWIPE